MCNLLEIVAKYKTPAFVDEVGYGAMFGELVACAVIVPEGYSLEGVKDSKQLKRKTIYKLAKQLKKGVIYSFGIVSVKEIMGIQNIAKADDLAMTRAVNGLRLKPDAVFIDGQKCPKKIKQNKYAVIGGDSKLFGISAASIIAKDFRDHLITEKYASKFKVYHLDTNKGYRSPSHLMAIRKYGITKYHRSYMKQVQDVLKGKYDPIIEQKYKDRYKEI